MRRSRFNAEDAEFGQEDAEELSGGLTAYPCQVIRTWLDPRRPEVVRWSRFNAEDAEFGHEDTEELSWVLTAYPCQVIRTRRRAVDRWAGVGEGRGVGIGAGELSTDLSADDSGCAVVAIHLEGDDGWSSVSSRQINARSFQVSANAIERAVDAVECDAFVAQH